MSEIRIDEIVQSVSDHFENNKYSKVAVLVDEHTKKLCYPLIKEALPVHALIEIKSGEENKIQHDYTHTVFTFLFFVHDDEMCFLCCLLISTKLVVYCCSTNKN